MQKKKNPCLPVTHFILVLQGIPAKQGSAPTLPVTNHAMEMIEGTPLHIFNHPWVHLLRVLLLDMVR